MGGCGVIDDAREQARDSGDEQGDSLRAAARRADETPLAMPDQPPLPDQPTTSDGLAEDSAAASSDPADMQPEDTQGAHADPVEGEALAADGAAAENGETGGDADASAEAPPSTKSGKMDWYILKVQSNREDSIRDGLLRRVKIAGLDDYFDEVIVPTETVSEYKDGKRRTRKQKLWPGYLVVHMEINEETWFLVRETPGIGDFTGAGGKPTPMLATEVEKILRLVHPERHATKEKAPVKIAFEMGDRVKIKEGTFQNFDGEVCGIDHANGRVTVMTEIFSRKTPVEFDYWQIERV